MKNFSFMKWPLVLLVVSIIVLSVSLSMTTKPFIFALKKVDSDQKLDLGNFEKGHYDFYARWSEKGETVGATPADIEITTAGGNLLSTHMESNSEDNTSDFVLAERDHLKATVRILSTESAPGAAGELIIQPEKTTASFLLFIFSIMGIMISIGWIVVVISRSRGYKSDLHSPSHPEQKKPEHSM